MCANLCGLLKHSCVGRVLLGGRAIGQGVVLDRCNCAAADRASWLSISMQSSKQCACVFFDFDQDTCTKRVAARRHHPTIPFGHGSRAVASHAKILEKPKAEEGFSKVIAQHTHEYNNQCVAAHACIRTLACTLALAQAMCGSAFFDRMSVCVCLQVYRVTCEEDARRAAAAILMRS